MAAGVLVEERQHQKGLAAGREPQAAHGVVRFGGFRLACVAVGDPPFHGPLFAVQGHPGQPLAVGFPEKAQHPVVFPDGAFRAAVGGYQAEAAVGRRAFVLAVGYGQHAAVRRPQKRAGSLHLGQPHGRIVGFIGLAQPQGFAVAAGSRPGQRGPVGRPRRGAERTRPADGFHRERGARVVQGQHHQLLAAVHRHGPAVRRPVKVQRRSPHHRHTGRRNRFAIRRVGLNHVQRQSFRRRGGDAQHPAVGRPLHVVGRALGDGQRRRVDEHRAAHAAGGFQRLHAHLGLGRTAAADQGHRDSTPVRRPHRPSVEPVFAHGLRHRAADAARRVGNRPGGERAAFAAVGVDGDQLSVGGYVGNAVYGHGSVGNRRFTVNGARWRKRQSGNYDGGHQPGHGARRHRRYGITRQVVWQTRAAGTPYSTRRRRPRRWNGCRQLSARLRGRLRLA